MTNSKKLEAISTETSMLEKQKWLNSTRNTNA